MAAVSCFGAVKDIPIVAREFAGVGIHSSILARHAAIIGNSQLATIVNMTFGFGVAPFAI
jgi:hypothetical protein